MAYAPTTTVIQTGALGTITDTYLNEASSATNYETAGTVRVHRAVAGATRNHSLFQFNIQGLAQLKGQRITNAKFELYTASLAAHVSGTINLRQVLKQTFLTQATWAVSQTSIVWRVAGCLGATTTQTETTGSANPDHYFSSGDAFPDFAYTVPASNQFVTVVDADPVFTEYINELANGLWSENRGLLLRSPFIGTVTLLARSEEHPTASTRPKLTLTHRARTAYFIGDGLGM
jgi:hypothetical protein